MALSAEASAFNLAVTSVLLPAWETYLDSLTAGAHIQIVKMKPRLDSDHTGANKKPGTSGIDANLTAADYDFGKRFVSVNTPDILDSFRVSIGASGPLFFLITNSAGDIT